MHLDKVKPGLHRCISFLLCLLVLAALAPAPAMAEETAPKTVRVGWYEDAYNITGENGERSGYGYEFQQSVAAYTGWTYDYVKAGWSDLLELMEDGKIDLMSGVSYTEERSDKMLYSDLPMGKEKYYLYADLGHTDISSMDLSTLNGKTVGLLDGSVQADQFYEWEAKHNLHMQYVYVSSFGEAKNRVAHQNLDCIISTETPQWVEAGMSAIATTGGSDIYFVINKRRPDLKTELDNAMREMEYDKPFYADELYQRYLSSVSVAQLSDAEQDWLKQNGAIRVGLLKNDSGFSTYDAATGTWTGVINDYVDFASDCLSNQTLDFELVGYDTPEEELKALQNGEIDMVFHASQNPYVAEKNGFTLSNTFLTLTVAAVTTKTYFDENAVRVVAIPKDALLLQWYVAYNYPNWDVAKYDTIEQAETAVANGQADCYITEAGNLHAMAKTSKLHSVMLTQPGHSSFAVRRGNTELVSILNKTLKTMPGTMLTGALSMYNNVAQKVTVVDFIKDNLLVVSIAFTTLFVLILLLILSLLRKSRRAEAKARQFALETQELNRKLQQKREELQTALTQAENANRAKTTFMNNMSHDIRTPMNAIVGFTNIALGQDVNDEVRNCLVKISDSSELLLSLINDVLDISRIESGRVKYTPTAVDITTVVDATLNVASGLLLNRKLEFRVERNRPENPYVLADAVRMREILVNILSNAVKFTDDGGTITFAADAHPAPDGKHLVVRYVIADTGRGMSEEFQKQIFDEFAQEQTDARTKYKGTGLGMSITKHYVDMMGGTIDLQSKKGVGTTFTVEIPLEIVPPENAPKQEKPVDVHSVAGVNLLLAEDNDLNAEIAMVQLESVGITATRAVDGEEVVKLFRENPPGTFDIILMDVMMPKQNGYEATAQIRALADRPDGCTIPIIALTANAFAEDMQASLDAGMNGHLSKPIVVDDLVKTIARNVRK